MATTNVTITVMTAQGHTLFDTAIGCCGIAWNGSRITGVQLPESSRDETAARMRWRFPNARANPPPPAVEFAIDGIVGLLRGEPRDLTPVVLDMDTLPSFHRRVYEIARTISPGTTLTYGDIAMRLGATGSARAVGQALGRNPFAIIVPCHRVLAAGNKTGGFSASGGIRTKLRLLGIEGALGPVTRGLFDDAEPTLR